MEVMNPWQSKQVGSEEAIPLSPQAIQRRHYLIMAQKHGFRPPPTPAPAFSAKVTPSLPPGFRKASGRSCRSLLVAAGLGVVLVALGLWGYGVFMNIQDNRVRQQQINFLKQIGLAFRVDAIDRSNGLPAPLAPLKGAELRENRELVDPASGQRFFYVGSVTENEPQAILTYSSPDRHGGRMVLLGDGSVLMMNANRFAQFEEARRNVSIAVTRPD
jgi:hypothetical protein